MATMAVQALLVADRLDPRGLDRRGMAMAGPMMLADVAPGHAFAFRWGAIVTIGALPGAAHALAEKLRPHLHEPLGQPVEETTTIRIDTSAEGPDAEGVIRLHDTAPERLGLLAEALAKSAVLSHQEALVARSLDRLDPVLARLRHGRLVLRPAALLASIGDAIAARSRATARIDTAAKSDLLWDHPELAPLHAALAAEWELVERSEAVAGKLEMVREMSETLLALAEARRSRVLEIAIVALIASELAASLYGLIRGG